jgi:hypothetical protein
MQERDRALGAPARGRIDQLDAIDLEAEERLGEVRDLEADVVEALAFALEEARDAGRRVRRLDELDLGLADPQERDPDAVRRDVHDRLEIERQRIAPETQGRIDGAHDQCDVVDASDPLDGLREVL